MTSKIKNIAVNSLLGFLLCIIIGLLFYGTNIFNITLSCSQILFFGASGAIFYSFYKFGNKRETVFVGASILIANLVLQGKPFTFTYFLRDIMFFMSLYSALIFYRLFLKKYYSAPMFVRALALALFLGLLNIASTLILILLFNPTSLDTISALFLNARYGALIGIGLGIGFDLYEKYRKKIISISKSY